MAFYDLSKSERQNLVKNITKNIASDLKGDNTGNLFNYFSDDDTYIRKAAYRATGRMYAENENLRKVILVRLEKLLQSDRAKVRQAVINSVGEIGMQDFEIVSHFFDKGLFDTHHSVRNAVIGSIKKMGEKNPKPTLKWAKRYLQHPEKEIRREICHGIELRGRTHPQDILPILEELQFDRTARVKNTLIHVLGQIAYKKGCLQTVVMTLKKWENKELVEKALDEIVDVHKRYKDFAVLTQRQAIEFIDKNYR